VLWAQCVPLVAVKSLSLGSAGISSEGSEHSFSRCVLTLLKRLLDGIALQMCRPAAACQSSAPGTAVNSYASVSCTTRAGSIFAEERGAGPLAGNSQSTHLRLAVEMELQEGRC